MVFLYSSSSGQALTGESWLDAHFDACRLEYEALFDVVPFETGSLILDAGCGTGSFVPLLADAAGPDGAILAVDFAFEHAAHVASIADGVVADVGHLPLRPESVDAIWSANVSQYFDDEGLTNLLDEFARVLRPGGFLALKDVDMKAWMVEPAPPFLGTHLAEACAKSGHPQSVGSIRGRQLRRRLEQTGFKDVEQHSLLIERWAPLDAANTRFWADWLVYLADVSVRHDLPEEERSFWRQVSTPDQAAAYVASPSFYGAELQVVAFGRKSRSPR
jgi:SAM-dependent methyltransferase